MKKLLQRKWYLLVLILSVVTSAASYTTLALGKSSKSVKFADPNLEALVRGKIKVYY